MAARRATHHLWWRTNAATGFFVFGLPAVAAALALTATIEQFGLIPTLRAAAPACLVGAVPLLLWSHYVTHRPTSRRGIAAWLATGAAVAALVLLLSPLQWWSVPTLAVVISEILRFSIQGGAAAKSLKINPQRGPGQEVAR